MYFGFFSLPLDLPYAVGHVLAQHLPLGHHHNLALGYPASQKRQEGCQGRTAVGVLLFCTAQSDLYPRLVPGSDTQEDTSNQQTSVYHCQPAERVGQSPCLPAWQPSKFCSRALSLLVETLSHCPIHAGATQACCILPCADCCHANVLHKLDTVLLLHVCLYLCAPVKA